MCVMLVVFIFFSILFFPLLGTAVDDCMPTRCRKHGPKIQAPFRHIHRHPEYCGGYNPGFDVYCNDQKETVLVLPFSVKVIVKKIDYLNQKVHIYDPQKCLPLKLLSLNLSVSPFHFLISENSYLVDLVVLNCSVSNNLDSCPGGSSYKLRSVQSDINVSIFYPEVMSCPKIHEISSVPWELADTSDLHLNWSEPACGGCEAQGKLCSLKNYTKGHQIQCIEKPRTNQGASKRPLIAGLTLGSFLVLMALALLYSSYKTRTENQVKIEKFLEDYRALKPTRFSYSDIKRITNHFGEKLGEGGYGIVYKGKLSTEIQVAVKVLNSSNGNGEEFINEVGTIGTIHHVNVVRLVGFCAEGFRRALLYEFLPNESLEKFIFQTGPKRNSLGWAKLQDIALGIANGIEYLHQGCDQQILHFDIKPHNILLDHNLNPKICDFGLAKLCSKEKSAVSMTAARGTMGYIAPEVLSRTFGRVSYKSDVYSFGMLLLEMVGGRKNLDAHVNTSQIYFPQWIYNQVNIGEDLCRHFEEGEDGNIAMKLTIVGLWCIQWYPTDRPSMKAVVQMLEGDGDNLTTPPNPFPATNATNFIARIPERRYQTELALIVESE
ncbi:hypothetical protein BUALT_Bualt16G0051500 [Buddleja alternifolia]|uniref:Protein kinase domain-containing protein n=1 Tax=Buddleja alternifolia TaxID=168488 RepID=A0AAV6WEN0_9LAMI|nr:hypothetical protein BUALT_Bualt16G0051500 [Buddleja alternifolia]